MTMKALTRNNPHIIKAQNPTFVGFYFCKTTLFLLENEDKS